MAALIDTAPQNSTALIDTVLEIDTPEHLAFKARIAGPGRRMFAYLLDMIARVLIVVLFSVLSVFVAGVGLDGMSMGFMLLMLFILDWFYFFILEQVTGGRSLGKIALKLRVVKTNGLPITWRESFLRNLVRAADITITPGYLLLVGPIVMSIDQKFRRMGDLVAGTIVVVEENTEVNQETELKPDAQLLEELPRLLPLEREDLEALELFVNRPHISGPRRDELANIVAPIYAERMGLPLPKNPTGFLATLWARAQDPKRRIEARGGLLR